MAEKLSVQIALEGGKEIEAQLADIGKAGQKAFSDISSAAGKVGGFNNLDPSVVTKAVVDLGVKGPEAINKITEAVKTAARFETMVNIVKSVENAFTNLGTTVGKIITIYGRHEAAAAGLGRTGVNAATAISNAFGPVGKIILLVAAAVVLLATAFIKAIEQVRAIDAQARTLGSTFEKTSQVFAGLRAAGVSTFAAISEGLAKVQSDIDKVNLSNIEKAFATAQKNIAAGWPAQAAQLDIIRKAAAGLGPEAERAREMLDTLGRPFQDNVTPAIEAMIRSAGGAVKAIPLIGNELARLSTPAEKARFISQIMDQIKADAGNAVDGMGPMLEALQKMAPGIDRNKVATQQFGTALGNEITQLLDAGVSISDIMKKTEGMKQGQADAANEIVQTWNRIKAASEAAFTNLPIDKLNDAMKSFGPAATTSFGTATTAVAPMNKAMDDLNAKIAQAITGMSKLQGGGGGAAAGGSPDGLAGGGLMGGRGTGTSDSNLAWLSRGEHVMPARAVSQPGVLAFLEALRRTGGNLRGLLNGMGHFALGGLVGAPSFAGGGVAGMNHVTIAFPGLQPIGGLRASSAVVDELHRAAAMAQVRSGGRKPSRYG